MHLMQDMATRLAAAVNAAVWNIHRQLTSTGEYTQAHVTKRCCAVLFRVARFVYVYISYRCLCNVF